MIANQIFKLLALVFKSVVLFITIAYAGPIGVIIFTIEMMLFFTAEIYGLVYFDFIQFIIFICTLSTLNYVVVYALAKIYERKIKKRFFALLHKFKQTDIDFFNEQFGQLTDEDKSQYLKLYKET